MIRRRLTPAVLPVAIGLSSALLLTGCLSLLPAAQNAPSIYRMDTSTNQPAVEKLQSAPIIIIPKPITTRALSGDEIVLSPDGRRIAYAASSRWVEPVPSLVHNALLEGFTQSRSLVALPTGTAVRGDYSMQVQLHSFEAIFDNGEDAAPKAQIRLTLTLTNVKDRTFSGQKEFTVSQRSTSRGVSDITTAQTQVTARAVEQVVDWAQSYLSARRG